MIWWFSCLRMAESAGARLGALHQQTTFYSVLGAQKYVKVLKCEVFFTIFLQKKCEKMVKRGEKVGKQGFCGSKIVDYVMLAVDFGDRNDDAEAAEIEGDGARRERFDLLPVLAGSCVGMDATYNGDNLRVFSLRSG